MIYAREAPPITIPLTASTAGITTNPEYSLEFDQVLTGTTTTKTILVTGNGLSQKMDVKINGDDVFSVKKAAGWNDLTGGMLEVQFAPEKVNQAYNAEVVIESGSYSSRVMLGGKGSDKGIAANPASLVFSSSVGQPSATLTTDIKGVGITGNLTYEVIDTSSGQDSKAFGVKPGSNWKAATGGQLQVVFTPESERDYSAVLLVKDGGTLVTQINLIGSITPASQVRFTKAPTTVKRGDAATFEANGAAELLDGIFVDGKALTIKTDANGKRTIHDANGKQVGSISGSTTTTLVLDANYLTTLSLGEHTLQVDYMDLGSASAVFRMVESGTSPPTGDAASQGWIWLVVPALAITAFGMATRKKQHE
ncbi:hypothetical protein LJC55_02010 [Eubacteriales bacterium OttesenSCG-928-N14]|nr:hypothetical protein [Eubacteriales bacterium OttesenSCG-928-N14]